MALQVLVGIPAAIAAISSSLTVVAAYIAEKIVKHGIYRAAILAFIATFVTTCVVMIYSIMTEVIGYFTTGIAEAGGAGLLAFIPHIMPTGAVVAFTLLATAESCRYTMDYVLYSMKQYNTATL